MKVNVNFCNPQFYTFKRNGLFFNIILFVPLVLTIVTIRTSAVTTDFSNPDTSSIPNEVTKSILRLSVHKGRTLLGLLNKNFHKIRISKFQNLDY